jgi:DNA-binding CsgD family transcriptional regulator/tetratricopeptide (TPR) repeat protein
VELLERGPFLDRLAELLVQSEAGRGQVVLVGGEAGIGKSSLVEAFCDVHRPGSRLLAGACDPLTTPRPLGPWIEIASDLGGDAEALLSAEGRRTDLFDAVLRDLSTYGEANIVVLEDIHWADEATLDLLRWLARRLASTRTLLIATYRDDEVGPGHPLRLFLGDVATSASAHRLTLPPLSRDAVTLLAGDTDLDAGALHQLTGGNPFLVTEVLGAPSAGVPDTVRDAVLARISRLSSNGQAILEVAAVIGMRIEPDLLDEVTEAGSEAADESLTIGILRWEGDHLVFHHELTRAAVLEAIPAMRRRNLNGRVLAALTKRSNAQDDLARLAHHAEESGDHAAVLEYAPAAAQRAVGLHAHREAAAQYARALRNAETLPIEQRALMLEAHSYECYLTEHTMPATESRRTALEIWMRLGNGLKAGENLRWLSRLLWFAGQNDEAEKAASQALEILEVEPPGPQLAWAYSNLSQLRMLAQDSDAAILWGEKAIALAEQCGETEILVHALNNVGVTRLRTGDEEGRRQLEQSLELARAADFEEHVSRALGNLGSCSLESRDFKRADVYLDDGISYCTEHNFDYKRFHMVAGRAESHLHQGRWDEAVEDAVTILRNPYTVPPLRCEALRLLGLIRVRRGDPDAWPLLDEALSLAVPTREFQHIGRVRATRAEAAWLGGEHSRAAQEARAGLELAAGLRDPWRVGELTFWLWRASGTAEIPQEIAELFALEIGGQWRTAAERWYELGCPYDAALALMTSDDEADLRRALAEFERLGARPCAAAVARRLRSLGAKDVPRGPRPATRANPANLTTRELEILDLVALGLRDAEIADRLFLSPKTVGHHVSSILGKLGVRSRAEAANLMRDRELLPHR